ncbi:hypothetical protein [Paenibacillus xylaniclasticus]|uniref:hypothetical protein n=1 Tax=Paenibacillus xylaniclasticus TaxID=588083 RepID=UPI000FDC2235|nr:MULTISPECIES: hypothetical protein [Paenibacillus]GFN31870.1 hypothetical protein PCURB6_21300 [Paenibacillus curdlanolyticus]
MIGTWRWNIGFGAAGSVLTLLFSLNGNTLAVSCMRAVYAFGAFFLAAYLFRAILKLALTPQPSIPVSRSVTQDNQSGQASAFEAVTPDETEALHDLLKPNSTKSAAAQADTGSNGFQPLNPPKLVSTQNKEPEELAKAIRHMTGG